nr:MAG TPA: helix-turn-helix domain protein [Caudoviricetes sp.]
MDKKLELRIGGANMLHVTEAAKRAKCSKRTLERRIKSGAIKAEKIGASWFVSESELKKLNVRTGNYGNKKA